MQVMGTNTWEFDADTEVLVSSALEFADMVKDKGIAELLEAYIAEDANQMWCSWSTDDPEGLQAAFDEMNRRTGLSSTLTMVTEMYHTQVG